MNDPVDTTASGAEVSELCAVTLPPGFRLVVNPGAHRARGMQPARVQLVPPIRPAGHQIKPAETGGHP